MKIFNFKEFLLESITNTLHYSDRTTIDNPESRANHKSSKYPNGWDCKELIEVSNKGDILGKKISLEKFLELSKSENVEDFNKKVEIAIQEITNNEAIWNIETNSNHSFVNLGKIAFEVKVGDNFKYYSPILISEIIQSKESEKKKGQIIPIKIKDIIRQGTNLWMVIKNKTAQTILFYPEGEAAFPFIKKQCEKNRVNPKYDNLKVEDYVEGYVDIKYNLIENKTTYFIYNVPEWRTLLSEQIKDPDFKFKFIPKEWKNLFKKESVLLSKGTILYTPDLNIKERVISEIVQYKKDEKSVEVKFEKIMSKTPYKIRLGNISIIREDKEIRKVGKLPLKGDLVKTYNVEGFTVNYKNIIMTARLIDTFVLDKEGNIIRSEYDEKN